jgi:hypothetical protein
MTTKTKGRGRVVLTEAETDQPVSVRVTRIGDVRAIRRGSVVQVIGRPWLHVRESAAEIQAAAGWRA